VDDLQFRFFLRYSKSEVGFGRKETRQTTPFLCCHAMACADINLQGGILGVEESGKLLPFCAAAPWHTLGIFGESRLTPVIGEIGIKFPLQFRRTPIGLVRVFYLARRGVKYKVGLWG